MTEYVNSTEKSKLWRLLTKVDPNNPYPDQIAARYVALRTNILSNGQVIEYAPFSFETIIKYYEKDVIDKIGQKFYNIDADSKYLCHQYHIEMCSGSRLSFTRRWLRERLIFLDSLYEAGMYTNKRIALRSNTKVVGGKITIKTYSPQMIRISLQDGAAPVKERCDKNGTTFTFDISNDENNNTTIFGCDNIMSIEGLDALNISYLDISNATKLTNLDVHNNTRLSTLVMGQNSYLRTINLDRCKSMGTDSKVTGIDLSNCTNLRKVKITNTSLASLKLNNVGGYIDYLDVSGSPISALDIVGQSYLKDGDLIKGTGLILSSKTPMSSFSITDCHAIENISIIQSNLVTFTANNCKALKSIDISGTTSLRKINTILCPNLTKLVLQGINGVGVETLDLTTLDNLTYLDIASSYVKYIKLGQYTDETGLHNRDTIQTLICNNSSIITIKHGTNATFNPTDILDLAALPNLTKATFSQCPNIKQVENINLVGNTSFSQCSNLTSVRGRLVLSGNEDNMFYGCYNLVELPETFDLTGVTSLYAAFEGCKKLNMEMLKKILGAVSGKLTSASRAFLGCYELTTNAEGGEVKTGIIGELPDDIFAKCTGLANTERMFYICYGITGGLDKSTSGSKLEYMKNLSHAKEMFAYTGLTIAPTAKTLFGLTKLSNVSFFFEGCASMTGEVPSNIFNSQKNVLTTCHRLFSGCISLGEGYSLPQDIIKRCPKLIDVGYMFTNTKFGGEIPADFFNTNNGSNNALIYCGGIFSACKNLTGKIPESLFSLCTSMKDFREVFSGCSGLTGIIPEKLLDNNPLMEFGQSMFNNCSKLGTNMNPGEQFTIPARLFKGKKSLKSIGSMFRNLSNITGTIEQGTFDDCISLNDVSWTFSNTGLSGQLPIKQSHMETHYDPYYNDPEKPGYPQHPDMTIEVEVVDKTGLFNSNNIAIVEGLFAGCTKMVSTIPEDILFGATTALKSTKYMFQNCYRIIGGVPARLFEKCVGLQDTTSMFQNARTLNENKLVYDNDYEDGVYYAIPKELFKNNPDLLYTSSMFDMYQENAELPQQMSGVLPRDIFKYNPKLINANAMFSHSYVGGHLYAEAINSCTNLRNVSSMFRATKLTSMDADVFSTCTKSINFYWTFSICNGAGKPYGETFDVNRLKVSPSNKTECFRGSSFTNLANIPSEWK